MKQFLALLVLLTLTACIEVDDIRGMWAKGTIDPALEGAWSYQSDADSEVDQVTFRREKDYYVVETFDKTGKRFTDADATFYLKTIETTEAKYMIVAFPDDPAKINGMVWPYRLTADGIETAQITACASCAADDPDATPGRIGVLDDAALAKFDKILAKPGGWTLWMQGKRIQD